MSLVLSVVARCRHGVLMTFSPGYRQIHERLKQIAGQHR